MKAIFLDDERFPKTKTRKWRILRSGEETITHIAKYGCPLYISFDNDLGTDKLEGIDVAHWLVEMDLNNKYFIPKDFEFNIHSANSIAGPRIYSLLTQYLKMREYE